MAQKDQLAKAQDLTFTKISTFLLNFRAFMTGEQSYKYYNEFMWKGRYAECISVEETIDRMKG